jgi:hypothetical protein
MYHVANPYCGDTWIIGACVEDDTDCVASLKTDFRSDESEDCEALGQLLHDEFGAKDALYTGGEMFEIVAVPDDVAVDFPASTDVAILAGERCEDREAIAELSRVCSGTVFEYPEPRCVR